MPDIFKRKDLGVVRFGVFKGKKWGELREDYLKWVCTTECNTSDENKDLARQELAQRVAADGQLKMF